MLAAFAAAVPMATWAAGRRTAEAIDQFVTVSGPPDVSIDMCPEGVEPDSPDELAACNAYVPSAELALIRSMPGVREAGRASWTMMLVATSVDGPARGVTMIQVDGADVPTWSGDPVVVAGRLPAAEAPDELLVSDGSAAALGIEPGSQVWISDLDGGSDRFVSTVVGVVRTVGELVPENSDSPLASGNPMFHAGAGWSRAHGDDVLRASNSIGVFLDDTTPEQFVADLRARLPGRLFQAAPPVDSELLDTARQATGYESRAAAGVAVVAMLAGAFLVAQAVARQSRRESDDRDVLIALGASRRDLVMSSMLRWSLTAVLAAAVAVVLVVAASTLGPIGIGRRGPWAHGFSIDPLVLAVGVPVVMALVVAAGVVPTLRRAPRRPLGVAVSVPGPPSIGAGTLLALRGIRRGAGVPILSAIGAIAVAVAVLVAVASGAATIRDVTAHPIRYGADFDAIVGIVDDSGERQEDLWAQVAAHPDVVAASGIPGMSVQSDRGDVYVQAFVPVDGFDAVRPVITAGREPTRADEIALGTLAMREAGLAIDDRITLRPIANHGRPVEFTVVGEAMVTDNYEPRVGAGGVLTAEGLARIAPEAIGGAAVRVTDGAGHEAALARVQEAFTYQYTPVVVPMSLQNAERIAGLPVAIGALTALLAAVTLSHALLVCVRRQRRELAVYKSLGFTRGQVLAAVTTEATRARCRRPRRRHPARRHRRPLGLADHRRRPRPGGRGIDPDRRRRRDGDGRARRRQPRRRGARLARRAHPGRRGASRGVNGPLSGQVVVPATPPDAWQSPGPRAVRRAGLAP